MLTVSIHADPALYYPFVWGYAHERGDGPGLGANFNIPLPNGTGDDDYIKAIGRGGKNHRAFAPGALVVALGLDASEHDPLAGLAVTTAGFRPYRRRDRAMGLPTFSSRRADICPIFSATISRRSSAVFRAIGRRKLAPSSDFKQATACAKSYASILTYCLNGEALIGRGFNTGTFV